jgi:hypothetical protein
VRVIEQIDKSAIGLESVAIRWLRGLSRGPSGRLRRGCHEPGDIGRGVSIRNAPKS